MAVFMLLATLYAVAQLAVIGWPARSVRFGTLTVAMAVGLYGAGPVALALELLYTRTYASATSTPLSDVVRQASYTVDPVIEEVVKVLPLLIVVVGVRVLRRQWGLTDYLLLGAATGGGFALAEGLLRWGQSAAKATSDPAGGWNIIPGLSYVHIPGVGQFLGTWLPAADYSVSALSFTPPTSVDIIDIHLVWTSMVAFGLGVLVRAGGWRKVLGLLPLVYTCLDHAAFNYAAAHLATPPWDIRWMTDIRTKLWLYPLILIVLAVVLDLRVLRRAKAARPDLLLAAERSGSASADALMRFASVSPRRTVPVAYRFLMARRSLLYALSRGSDLEVLAASVRTTRTRMDAAHDKFRWQAAGARAPSWRARLTRVLRSWQLWLWLVLLLPSLLYLVLGSFPPLKALQRELSGTSVFPVMAAFGAIGLLWLGWQLIATARRMPAAIRQQYGEPVARLGFRLLSGTGALAAGVTTLVVWLRGAKPTDPMVHNFHILDALSNALLAASLALFIASFFLFPPLGLVELVGGGFVLVATDAAGTFVVSEALAALLGSLGIVLSQASSDGSGGDSSGGDGSGSGDPPDPSDPRLDELAKDPAHGGKITPGSLEEAKVGLSLEDSGQLDGPITRDPTGGSEFIDANGQDWDVKSFNSNYPASSGGYDLDASMAKIGDAIRTGENVILNTSNMSPEAVAELRTAVQATSEWAGKILWWP